MNEIIKAYELGGMTLIYSTVEGVTSFLPIPSSKVVSLNKNKLTIEPLRHQFGHLKNEPLVQISKMGEVSARDFSSGISKKNSAFAYSFKLVSIHEKRLETGVAIQSLFKSGDIEYLHNVFSRRGTKAIEVWAEVKNNSGEPLALDMLASFSLTNISPFCLENDVENIFVHKLKSNWSAEGVLETRSAADLQLEDSWSHFGMRMDRISQVGSMPARGYLPFVAVEDKNSGTTWAVQLEAPASWQIDVTHHNTYMSISGGLADINIGHWRKTIESGECFRSHKAYITVCSSGLENACARLNDYISGINVAVGDEDNLPIIYNEYCYTWGTPSMQKLNPLIEYCKKIGIDYFVMDSGWYRDDNGTWNDLGDWAVNTNQFPKGLGEYCKAVSDAGMLPGIWLEFESLTDNSLSYKDNFDCLLRRDGVVIKNDNRCFLDFRLEKTQRFLEEKIVRLIRENGVGYIKVDYNENIGLGVDGAESVGEGLRAHIDTVVDFFKKLKSEFPRLIIEICSSGGMRHEPLFISLSGMVSFSDAHEGFEGAAVAANLHRYIHPKKMQVWATIRCDYKAAETYYTITKAMLGRYCLSGNIAALEDSIKAIVEKSIGFYRLIAPVIRSGETIIIDSAKTKSLHSFHGTQRLVRVSDNQMLCYLHSVDDDGVAEFNIAGYEVSSHFGNGEIKVCGDSMKIAKGKLCGQIVLLNKKTL